MHYNENYALITLAVVRPSLKLRNKNKTTSLTAAYIILPFSTFQCNNVAISSGGFVLPVCSKRCVRPPTFQKPSTRDCNRAIEKRFVKRHRSPLAIYLGRDDALTGRSENITGQLLLFRSHRSTPNRPLTRRFCISVISSANLKEPIARYCTVRRRRDPAIS
jgi:hypothetical protein